ASTSPEQVKTRSLQELIAFNQQHKDIELTLFDQSIFVVSQAMGTLDSTEYKHARKVTQKTAREEGINKLLTENKVNVLVAPTGPVAPRVDPINGDIWPNSWPGYGSHAARAGYPHITVPMGGVHSLSVGLSLIGNKNTDVDVLAYAYAYEQQSMERLEPQYLSNAEELDEIGKAMKPYSK
ncbi:MAG: amidase, partial [Paraglaciecola sp.]